MSYSSLAKYYDTLTRNVNYSARADYLIQLLKKMNHEPGLTLDLACGTGSLTLELAERGFDVYGLDASPEMLSVAQQKAAKAGHNILFICQKMQQMDLYGGVDTAVCMLDSVNHITMEADLQESFRRMAMFLNPGGLFVFDANTEYKHRNVLANNVFIYDMENVYCVWQNRCEPKSAVVNVSLDLFERLDDGTYHRSSEHFQERAYSEQQLRAMLERAGLKVEGVWADLSFEAPKPETERLIVAASKPR
jgi:ubiquinone/menaquinone biosynthesis C-methylase UbiE